MKSNQGKKPVVPCTREEMDALINASIDSEFYEMLFKVARKTGRRLGEYCGIPEMKVIGKETVYDKYGKPFEKEIKKKTNNFIDGVKVKDVDFGRKVMMTRVLKRRRKVEKEAILNDDLLQLIQKYITRNGLKLDDYLFRGITQKRPQRVSYRQVQNKVKSYAKKAGINHSVSFHNFRHFFVTELFKAGWSYDRIAKLTGHSSVGTLSIYDHTVASDIADEARSAINNL